MRTLLLLLLGVIASALTMLRPQLAAAAMAPGCTADRPTYVGGTIYGYPDGRAVYARMGVVIGDSSGHYYLPDGTPMASAAPYSWTQNLNPSVGPDGTTAAVAPDGTPVTRQWGQCVTAKATRFWVEAGTGYRDGRYAPTAYYNGIVTPGGVVEQALRLQLTYQAAVADGTPALGDTGGVQGYVWHAATHTYIDASHLSMDAFPGAGALCGIRGYAPSAPIGTAANPSRTFYKMGYLVGGQCWAASQSYALWVTCRDVCGAPVKVKIVTIAVVAGHWPRVDILL